MFDKEMLTKRQKGKGKVNITFNYSFAGFHRLNTYVVAPSLGDQIITLPMVTAWLLADNRVLGRSHGFLVLLT